MSGQLHRAHQIFCTPLPPGVRTDFEAHLVNTDLIGVQYALWELIRELHGPPLSYPLPVIKSSLFGFRNPWAEALLKTTRTIVDAFPSHNDEQ